LNLELIGGKCFYFAKFLMLKVVALENAHCQMRKIFLDFNSKQLFWRLSIIKCVKFAAFKKTTESKKCHLHKMRNQNVLFDLFCKAEILKLVISCWQDSPRATI
jgi:hypothetical protein